jgi:hypothetical protein
MTCLRPAGSSVANLPATSRAHPPRLDLQSLRAGIDERRRKLLDLELAMVAKCEAQAARGRASTVQMRGRETWDRPTWNRYIAAAAALEGQYGPPMRRLLREIDQLERVLALPITSDTAG